MFLVPAGAKEKPAASFEAAGFFHDPDAPEGRLPAVRRFRQVKGVGSGSIDDRDSVIFPLTLEESGIGLVYVAVNHHSGAVPVQQGTEAFKPHVGRSILVPDTADRRMGTRRNERDRNAVIF